MSEAGNSGPESLENGKAVAYRVLARKYRPSNFSELVGQEPMVRTLTNAFATGRIAQAWMLTGVRGVGKTTTARILARALNYKTADMDQPSVDLAVLGEHCQAIMEGRHVDVIEMDAASHTGIDDIRDIIERVRYAPVSARYKVYIIDEVHMLSTQAFNGLLKTLEEPPPHVKFIFATTEIRKVPITVPSRCQRFDLRRIDAGALVAHLSSISAKEGISVDDDALAMIARAAEGSARDSLSILDQAIAHGAGSVSADAVRAMLGLADRAPSLRHIVYSDPRGLRKYSDPRLMSAEQLVAKGRERASREPALYDSLVDATQAEDVAILCTTSGTTSHPKLAMLAPGRMLRHCATYLDFDPKGPEDEYVSVLPLPWIMEQVYALGKGLLCRMKVNFVEEPETMMNDLREIAPTFVLFAPRVWEAIAADVRARVMDASALKQGLYELGMKAGLSALARNRHSVVAETLLFRALRDRLGFTRLRSAATGGAEGIRLGA